MSLQEKLSWMGSCPEIQGKIQEGSRSRTYQEAKRRAQEVVGPDGHLLKIYGERKLNLQIELLQEDLLEIKRSNAELVDALKRMTVSQKIESSAKAIELALLGPPTILSLRSRTRKHCDFCKMKGHTEEYCWRKHPEKRSASLAQMSVDNTSSKIVEEIRGILHENEKKLHSLVNGFLKEVVKKQVKESYINMMSYPHAQDSPTSKMKPMKRPENKNPRDSLIYLKGFVGCLQAQVLVDNGANLSFINEKCSQKLSLKHTLRKFMISLGDGQLCYAKGEVSLDLRLADGMSFKTHLQVIHAEITYDILLGMDFMKEKCVNSGFYRTQEGPR